MDILSMLPAEMNRNAELDEPSKSARDQEIHHGAHGIRQARAEDRNSVSYSIEIMCSQSRFPDLDRLLSKDVQLKTRFARKLGVDCCSGRTSSWSTTPLMTSLKKKTSRSDREDAQNASSEAACILLDDDGAAKLSRTVPNFSEEEVCMELAFEIEETEEHVGHLKTAHQRRNVKEVTFEMFMQELNAYFDLMRIFC